MRKSKIAVELFNPNHSLHVLLFDGLMLNQVLSTCYTIEHCCSIVVASCGLVKRLEDRSNAVETFDNAQPCFECLLLSIFVNI